MAESNQQPPEQDSAPMIHVRDLNYLFPDGTPGLQSLSLDLPRGSRTLLIGGTSILIPLSKHAPTPIPEPPT